MLPVTAVLVFAVLGGVAQQTETPASLIEEGRLIFDRTCLDRLLESKSDISLLVDRSIVDEPPDARPPESAPDLVVERDVPPPGRRYLPSRTPGVAVRVGMTVWMIGRALN